LQSPVHCAEAVLVVARRQTAPTVVLQHERVGVVLNDIETLMRPRSLYGEKWRIQGQLSPCASVSRGGE
jgi:hypothetical protein